MPHVSLGGRKRVAIHLADPGSVSRMRGEHVSGQVPRLHLVRHAVRDGCGGTCNRRPQRQGVPVAMWQQHTGNHSRCNKAVRHRGTPRSNKTAACYSEITRQRAGFQEDVWGSSNILPLPPPPSAYPWHTLHGMSGEGWRAHIRVEADIFGVFEPQGCHAAEVLLVHQNETAHLPPPSTCLTRAVLSTRASHALCLCTQRAARSLFPARPAASCDSCLYHSRLLSSGQLVQQAAVYLC